MRISLFGLGYVGAVTAACLADRGYRVIGVDVSRDKVESLKAGRSPIVEEEIGDIVSRAATAGNLSALTDANQAIESTDVSLVCVGTPSKANGDLDLQYVTRVCEEIGVAIGRKSSRHTVIIRSTVLPGTTQSVIQPILEKVSGKKAGRDFGLCFNPEFLREGSSVRDFYAPPFTIVGVIDPLDAEVVREIYGWLDCEFVVCDIPTAEMLKYINNSYHGIKVAFANEVGRLCGALGIDSHPVMDIFCKDTKQNLSAYYLKPGYAFGGSCLPKDLRAILYKAKTVDVSLDTFQAALDSNRKQMDLGLKLVVAAGSKKVGLLGLSFKAGTDDLRESPLVFLTEQLLGRGYKLKIFDSNVSLSKLVGANKAYIEKEIPHIGDLLCDSMEQVIQESDTIIIGNPDKRFGEILPSIPANKTVIDLVRIAPDRSGVSAKYVGIGW